MILAFIVAGVLSLFGALAYSELGTTFVSAGADAHYLSKSFGPSAGFAFNWTLFLVIGPGACAACSRVAAIYLLEAAQYAPSEYPWTVKIIAICIIVVLALVNSLVPEYVAVVNKGMMAIKLSSAVFVVIGAFVGASRSSFLFAGDHCFAGTDWTNFIAAVVLALFGASCA